MKENSSTENKKQFRLCKENESEIWTTLAGYLVPCAIAIVCYANGLQGPFLHDDTFAIKNNPDVIGQNALMDVFRNDFWGMRMDNIQSHKSYRPLCILSFRLDYYLSSGNPVWFHMVNTILHLFVTLMISVVCLHVLHSSCQFACISSSLFAAHPVHTEAVTGLVGRADVLAGLFFLLSFFFYSRCIILHHKDINYNESVRKQPLLWQTLTFTTSMILAVASMLCKETGITVLSTCVLYDFLCHGQVILRTVKIRRWSNALIPVAVRSLIVAVIGVTLLFFRLAIMNFEQPVFLEEANPAAFSPSLLTRFLTYAYLPTFNLWLLLNPAHLCYDWAGGSVPLLNSLTDPRNLASLTVYSTGLLIAWNCWVTWWKQCQQRENKDLTTPLPSAQAIMALGFLILPFLLATNLFFVVGFVVAERVLYIPSIGFCLLVTHGLLAIHARLTRVKGQVWMSVLVFVLAVLAARTWDRNRAWDSRRALFWSGVRTVPHNAKVHYNMGNLLTDEGDKVGAEHYYRRAISLSPKSASYHLNLGTILRNSTEAELCYREALSLHPRHTGALVNIGSILIERKNSTGLLYIQRALEIDPNYYEGLLALSYYYMSNKDYMSAEKYVKKIVQVNPEAPQAHLCHAYYLHNIGQLDEAVQEYEHTLRLAPQEVRALYYKAKIISQKGQLMEAKLLLEEACRLNRNCTECLSHLATVQSRLGNKKDAIITMSSAYATAPNDTMVTLKYVQTLKESNQIKNAWEVMQQLLLRKPHDQTALNFAFKLAMENNRRKEALQYINEVIAIARTEQMTNGPLSLHYNDLGEAHRLNNNNDSAQKAYETAVQLNSTFVEAIVNLGSIHHIKKNYEQAEEHYNWALKIDKNNQVAKENLQKLRTTTVKK